MTKHTERPAEDAQRGGTELVTLPSEGRVPSPQLLREAKSTAADAAGEGEETSRRPTGTISLYLHALRRHWPLAISLGLVCALAAAIAAWFLATDKYTAVSLLQISANAQQLVFQTADRASASTFEIYKGTQQQLVTSDFVLIAALRKPETAGVSLLQKEEDPVRWLARNVRVDFPGNAEIMRVSLTAANADESATLVKSVVDAYMNEAVNVEQKRQRDRLNELENLYKEREDDMRTLKTELKNLAEGLGTGDTGALALKQQIALQQYAEARNEYSRIKTELKRAEDDQQSKIALLDALPGTLDTAADTDNSAVADPMVAKWNEQIEDINSRLSEIKKKVQGPVLEKLTAEYSTAKDELQKKLDDRLQKLAKNVKKTTTTGLNPQIAELNSRIEILKEQAAQAGKDLEEQRKNAERFGNSSIEVEMKRSELQHSEKVLSPIADERDKLKVELQSKPRIVVRQPADAPKSRDGAPRWQTAAVGGAGGFFAIVFLVLWWDVRKQRINSLIDLDRGLGLTVVGTIPLLPQKVMGSARPSKRHRKWQASLDHAVDSIAARLFLRKDAGGVRVVLVSSATQGEGKTSLAVNLAKRLARTGERTLLVDFDLRRPTIHHLFGVPRGPGVGECLEGGCEPSQVAQPTETDNLSIITAGRPLLDSLGPLANGVTTSFFQKARAEFSFVIIDGSPILPVIDGLLTSQHADTVVLSIRRDTSEAPKVIRACEKLTAFGSRKYVVVLNGSQEDMYGGYQEQIIQARVEAVDEAETAKA